MDTVIVHRIVYATQKRGKRQSSIYSSETRMVLSRAHAFNISWAIPPVPGWAWQAILQRPLPRMGYYCAKSISS